MNIAEQRKEFNAKSGEANRVPVTFRYDGLNWDFIKMLAEIAHYAGNKYGKGNPDELSNYREPQLINEKSPINHIYEHLRQYQTGEHHDHFKDPIYHLAAIAYNAMMEAYYHRRFGHRVSPLNLREPLGACAQASTPIEKDRRHASVDTLPGYGSSPYDAGAIRK